MSADLSFIEHNKIKVTTARKMKRWIMRIFKTREIMPMVTLFKSLVLPHLEYCLALMAREISDLIQRSFTAHI